MNQPQSNSSQLQQASLAVAGWLEIDLEHVENQVMLTLNQAFGHTNKDWANFTQQCERHNDSYLHLLSGDMVPADQYACSLCHKSFQIKRPEKLQDCHSCKAHAFYQASSIDMPIYLH